MKFRKGDVVTIEATIASTPFNMDDGRAKVKIEFPPYCDAYVDPSQLTMARPKFEVGDKVEWTVSSEGMGSAFTGHILSIANDHLWVQLDDGSFSTVWASKAMRVDPEPVVEAEAA
jgi:hypothetical protein